MKLSDLMGCGFEIVMINNDGTVKHLTTTEEVEQELEDRKNNKVDND